MTGIRRVYVPHRQLIFERDPSVGRRQPAATGDTGAEKKGRRARGITILKFERKPIVSGTSVSQLPQRDGRPAANKNAAVKYLPGTLRKPNETKANPELRRTLASFPETSFPRREAIVATMRGFRIASRGVPRVADKLSVKNYRTRPIFLVAFSARSHPPSRYPFTFSFVPCFYLLFLLFFLYVPETF